LKKRFRQWTISRSKSLIGYTGGMRDLKKELKIYLSNAYFTGNSWRFLYSLYAALYLTTDKIPGRSKMPRSFVSAGKRGVNGRKTDRSTTKLSIIPIKIITMAPYFSYSMKDAGIGIARPYKNTPKTG
jgi:hypothetical protein